MSVWDADNPYINTTVQEADARLPAERECPSIINFCDDGGWLSSARAKRTIIGVAVDADAFDEFDSDQTGIKHHLHAGFVPIDRPLIECPGPEGESLDFPGQSWRILDD